MFHRGRVAWVDGSAWQQAQQLIWQGILDARARNGARVCCKRVKGGVVSSGARTFQLWVISDPGPWCASLVVEMRAGFELDQKKQAGSMAEQAFRAGNGAGARAERRRLVLAGS